MADKLAPWKVELAISAVAHGLWTSAEGTEFLKREWEHTNGRSWDGEEDMTETS